MSQCSSSCPILQISIKMHRKTFCAKSPPSVQHLSSMKPWLYILLIMIYPLLLDINVNVLSVLQWLLTDRVTILLFSDDVLTFSVIMIHPVLLAGLAALYLPALGRRGFKCSPGNSKSICLPETYSKFELPNTEKTNKIGISIDIDEVLRINDGTYSITFSTYFNVEWNERRLNVGPEFGASLRWGLRSFHLNTETIVMFQALQLHWTCNGPHELRVHQRPLDAQHLHLQPEDLQGDRRAVQAGWPVDWHREECSLQSGDSHHFHLSNEVRQVPPGYSDLQVQCWFLLLRQLQNALHYESLWLLFKGDKQHSAGLRYKWVVS